MSSLAVQRGLYRLASYLVLVEYVVKVMRKHEELLGETLDSTHNLDWSPSSSPSPPSPPSTVSTVSTVAILVIAKHNTRTP